MSAPGEELRTLPLSQQATDAACAEGGGDPERGEEKREVSVPPERVSSRRGSQKGCRQPSQDGERPLLEEQKRHDGEESSEDEDELHPSDESTFQTRIEFESDTYGCASIVLTYFWMDKSHLTWAFWRMVSQFVNLVAQVFLLYVTKEYVTFPSVLRARALYNKYHEDVFPDGVFDPDKWATWEHKGSLCQLPLSNKQFTFVMLCTWTSTVLIDMKQTVRFARAWWQLPNPTDKKRRLIIEEEEQEDRKAVVRAGPRLKVTVFCVVWIPKFLIALFTWWIGCRWLITTLKFSDVILNSVALIFILEIDELLYQTLEPHEVQEWVTMHDIVMPSIFKGRLDASLHGPERCKEMRRIRLHYSMKVFVGTAFICFGVPILYMIFQVAIPDYKWDVAVHCAGYIEEHWK